jgi:cell division septum initiation protein DivIVA
MPDQSSAATEHAILQEITRPLETLPDDPLSTVNAEFPTVLRGYDRVAVDEYVVRTRRLVAELQATRSPEAAVRRALERVGEQISGILQRAHETAEQITAQSRSEAEDRLEQVRVEADQIAGAAEQRVKDLDADTDRIWIERQRIVADAEDLAAQLLGLAKTAAERFPADGDGADGDGTDAGLLYDEDADAGPAYDVDQPTQAALPPFPVAEDEDLAETEITPRPDEKPEIERTVAFAPLPPTAPESVGFAAVTPRDPDDPVEEAPSRPGADEEAARRRGADEAPGSASPPPPRPQPSADGPTTDDDTTAVIPPASQAANRRASR